ncbi:MAG: AraC family transcriptional regulator [Roseburia sp.]|nr:AraC family transcriptional regulator [Roseburia sp.]MCM1241353.1 AraC family transcriptional regulator [Roseburia sp.]
MEWIQSINKAIAYIEEHLSEDIHGEDVAGYVNISLFHFQRTFNLLTGMTVGEYIRKRRLSLAGEELTRKGARVIDVAYKYGYETPESFSKAFTRFHGVTPKQAEKGTKLKYFNKLTLKVSIEGGSLIDYRIEQKSSFSLVVYPKIFTDENGTAEIPAFWTDYFQKRLDEKVSGNVGVCLQESMEEKQFMYGIGCFSEDVGGVPDGFQKVMIPAHTWAVFTCVGAMPEGVQKMWRFLYGEWLPEADYELIPNYDIENYPPGDKSAEDYVSEIWIPVKEKAKN